MTKDLSEDEIIAVGLSEDDIHCLAMLVHIGALTDDAKRCFPRRSRVAEQVIARMHSLIDKKTGDGPLQLPAVML